MTENEFFIDDVQRWWHWLRRNFEIISGRKFKTASEKVPANAVEYAAFELEKMLTPKYPPELSRSQKECLEIDAAYAGRVVVGLYNLSEIKYGLIAVLMNGDRTNFDVHDLINRRFSFDAINYFELVLPDMKNPFNQF